ncbi:MAG: PGF-pre-PGF domain-containing protein, partial [Methanosarcinaceae archaeon]|nr:PGF-pre-PGF domain-containing protein [Methanosarcinaceae archaeon]
LWGVYTNLNYVYSGGTSMSTPLVAGTAALVRQYYVQNESITPTSALLKATIINGAYNMTPGQYGTGSTQEMQTRPDYAQGWGRVDLENSLFPSSPRTMSYHDNITLTTSESWNYSYYVYNSSEPLRITLVWTDYPAAALAAVTLVNNLDLTVTGPGGTYYGNGATDSINNVEEVELLSPTVGSYTVQVSGTNIPQGPQPFALVVSGALNAEPLVTSYTANPSTIEANGTDNTTLNVTSTDVDGIASVTMDLSEIGGSAVQALANNSGVWQYTTNTTELGTFDLPVNVTDSLGVSNTSFSITLDTQDNTAPTPNSPADIGFSANATANFTYWKLYDLHPGYYWVLRNGTQVVSPTAWLNNTNITVPVNTNINLGGFNYTIQYNDTAGNSGAEDVVIITINDATAPSASGESPTNGSFVSDNTPLISVNITDDASGVNESSIVMTVNGSTVNATTTSISGGFSVSNQTVTAYTQTQLVNVTVNATDSYGNSLNHGWSFTVDGSGPILSNPVSTPQTIESNGTDTALLTVNGTDISGIESVTINLSAIGGSANAAMTNSSGTFSITTNATAVGTGSFNLSINATDNAGNSNTTVSIQLNTTDTTAPSLSDYLPVNGTSNLTPVICINATDRGSLINTSSAQMTVEGSEVILANTSSGYTYNFSNTTATAYNHSDLINVTFIVSDNDGQTSNISWAFYVDNVAPDISITSPATGYSTTASSITVSGTANGTGSPPSITVNDISADTTLSNFNGTFTATASLSVGANTIYANVTDAAGNTSSTSISVTRTTTPTSSSSGGGGGGGGTTGESYANIKFKDVSREYVNKDSAISFTFDEPENDIQHVKYRALTSSGYVSTTIEVLEDTSTFVSQAPSGVVYKNINIWVGRSGYATGNNIENPVVGFKVTKKWVTDNNIDVGSIKLNRYHDDVWNPLTTRMTGDDATYFYFEAETPGFSPFAITGQQKRFISEVSVRTEATEETTVSSNEEPVEAAAVSTEETGSTPEERSVLPYLLVGMVILIAIGAYLYMQRKQS